MIKTKKILIALAVIGANVLHTMPVYTSLAAEPDYTITQNNEAKIYNSEFAGGHTYDVQINGNTSADGLSETSYKGNEIIIRNGEYTSPTSIAGVFNGATDDDIISNIVTILNGTVRGVIYGGYSTNGAVSGNMVNIYGGTLGNIYGGWSNGKDATGNLTNIEGGTFASGAYIRGGDSNSGNATKNTLTIKGGTFSGSVTSSNNLYGGSSNSGNAGGDSVDKGNKVVIDNATFNFGTNNKIYGGYTNGSDKIADYNSVTINNGIFKTASGDFGAEIVGGKSAGTARYNNVTINNGTFEGTGTGKIIIIKGGEAITVLNNEVIINNGSFKNFEIYGGNNGNSSGKNVVTIKGGNFIGDNGKIYGSYTSSCISNQFNQVILEGGIFTGTTSVIAAEGKPAVGTYSDNSITLGGTNPLDLSGATLMGYETSGDNNSTLNVKRTNVKVGDMKNFGTINFNLAGATSDDIVLKMQNQLNLTNLGSVNITVEGINLVGGDYITLISNVSNSYTGSSTSANVAILDVGSSYDLVYYGGSTAPTTAKGDYTIKQDNGTKVWSTTTINGTYSNDIQGNVDGATLTPNDSGLSATSYSGNEVIIRRGTHNGSIYGANADNGDVSHNTVSIYGGDFCVSHCCNIYGGKTNSGSADYNVVNIYDGTFSKNEHMYIYGGCTSQGNANHNTINIYGGTFKAYSTAKKTTIFVGSANGSEVNAIGNSITIENAIFEGVSGASPFICVAETNGNAMDNHFIASSSTFGYGTQIIGGRGGDGKVVSGNSVEINDCNFAEWSKIYGGGDSFTRASANGNMVTIAGCNFGQYSEIRGGYTIGTTSVSGNIVTIDGGTFGTNNKIYGGHSIGSGTSVEDVSGNVVNINGGNLRGEIYGGRSEYGDAKGNIVNIYGGNFATNSIIHAGQAGGNIGGACADGNIVNIMGGTFADDCSFYGGYTSVTSSNNILNLKIKMSGKAFMVRHFQIMNFTLPSDIANGDVMLSTKDLQVDATPDNGTATINVYAANGVKLKAGNVITLVDVSNATTGTYTAGSILGGAAELCVEQTDADANGDGDNNDLVIKLLRDFEQKKSAGSEDQQKAPVEGVAAAAAIVNASADLASGQGMASLVANTAGGATDTFGAMSAGSSKYKTGSHVDVDGWGVLVGGGNTKNWQDGSATTYGLFFEYGKGDFDTYNGNVHGDGNSENKGVGIMARHKLANNTYYEGNIRYGKQETEWGESELGSYDTDSRYYGISVGVGHIYPVGKNEIDVYGRYTYGHVGACDAKLNTTEYHFDSVKSHRVRVGGKYNFKVKDSNAKPYVGLAWEHEFKGESKASISGVGEAPAPSMKGNTGIMEVGCDWNVSKKWTVGLGTNAYIGKRKGWDGMARVFYNF